MSNVGMDKIKQLRDITGAKFAECHKALEEAKGDIEAAKDILRIKGLAGAASKATREVSSGAVAIALNEKVGFMCKMCCETDYVAMNSQFLELLRAIADTALSTGKYTVDELMNLRLPDGNTVDEAIKLAISSIGENIRLYDQTAVIKRDSKDIILGSYVHKEYAKNIGKIGVLVALQSNSTDEKVVKLAHDLAMQVAAMKPIALNRNVMDPEIIEREHEVQYAKAHSTGKPVNIVKNIVQGSMEKFFKSTALVDQPFVISDSGESITVREKINTVAKEVGEGITIMGYHMYTVE